MRAVLQRVKEASVTVDGQVVGQVAKGWLALVCAMQGDEARDVVWMCDKILNLRAFSDEAGKMNLSVLDIKGELLVVSQFTLAGDCQKGRRPSFTSAAPAAVARELFEQTVQGLRESKLKVETGVFQADMKVALCNDGPVTLTLDSRV